MTHLVSYTPRIGSTHAQHDKTRTTGHIRVKVAFYAEARILAEKKSKKKKSATVGNYRFGTTKNVHPRK